MIDFIDRVSSGKKIIKYENGTTETVTIENAEDATVEGTPINRENMMAIQGYQAETVVFGGNSITKTNADGVETIVFQDDKIIKTFAGDKTIKITTTFTENGYSSEVE